MIFFSKGGKKQKPSWFGGKASKQIEWHALPKLLTIKQVCEILGVHPNTLRNWDDSGRLKAVRVGVRKDRRYDKDTIQKMYLQQHPAPPPTPTVKLPEPSDGGKYVLRAGWSVAKVKLLLISKKFTVFVYSIIVVAFSFFVVQSLFFAHVFVVQAEAQPVEQNMTVLEPTTTSGWENPDFAKHADVVASGTLESFTEKNSAVFVNRPVVVKGEATTTPALTATTPATEEPATMADTNAATNSAPETAPPPSDQMADLAKTSPLFEASGFTKPASATSLTAVQSVVAVFSFGAASFANNEDVVTFSFSADSGTTWNTLDSFPLTSDISNATHGGYWEFPITDKINNLDDLAKIKLRISYNAVPGAEVSSAYVDAANLRVTTQEPDKSLVNEINKSVTVEKNDYSRDESPQVDVTVQKRSTLEFLGAAPKVLTVKSMELTNPDGNTVDISPTVTTSTSGRTTTGEFSIDPTLLTKPGKYDLTTTVEQKGYEQQVVQHFTWSSIAVNVRHAIGSPNTAEEIGVAVLDDIGRAVCDAAVSITVTHPNGHVDTFTAKDKSVTINPKCADHNVTNEADYTAVPTTTVPGTYKIDVTAKTKSGSRSASDTFQVSEPTAIEFNVERTNFPTRVNPVWEYPVSFTVTPRQDYNGTVTETVPKNFNITGITGGGKEIPGADGADTKQIVWTVRWLAGKPQQLAYTFQSPMLRHGFSILGPLTIGTFAEARQWQMVIEGGDTLIEQQPQLTDKTGTKLADVIKKERLNIAHLKTDVINEPAKKNVSQTVVLPKSGFINNVKICRRLDANQNCAQWDPLNVTVQNQGNAITFKTNETGMIAAFDDQADPQVAELKTKFETDQKMPELPELRQAETMDFKKSAAENVKVESSGYLNYFDGKTYQTLPDVPEPGEVAVSAAPTNNKQLYTELPDWARLELSPDGKTVTVKDQKGTAIWIFEKPYLFSPDHRPYPMKPVANIELTMDEAKKAYPPNGLITGKPEGDSGIKRECTDKSCVIWDLTTPTTFTVDGNKIYALVPDGLAYPQILADATDTASTNSKDSHMRKSQNTFNYGATTTMYTGRIISATYDYRPIMDWTLSSGSGTISSIDLSLYRSAVNTYTSPCTNNDTVGRPYDLQELTQTFVEGTHNNTACTNDVSWNAYNCTNAWTTAGGDFSATVVDTTSVTGSTGAWYTWTLQGSGATNPIASLTWGSQVDFIIRDATAECTPTGKNMLDQFNTKENASNKPYITITYTTTISISGTANGNNGATVKVAVNGTIQAQTTTISGGTWTISGVTTPAVGDVITVFVDAVAEASETTAVTKYSSGDISGMVLNNNVLSIGAANNQSLTVTNLSQYTNSNNENVMQGVASSVLTVDAGNTYSAEQISILSGNTLTISGTETLATYDLNNAGTLTSGGNSVYNVYGSWTNSSTFTQSTSTVNFLATSGSKTIDNGASSFNNVVFNGSGGGWTQLTNGTTIGGTLTVTLGTFTTAGLTLTVTGTTTVNGGTLTLDNNTGTKLLTGAVAVSSGTLNGASTAIEIRNGITQSSTGAVSITGTATFTTNAQAIGGTVAIASATVTTVTLTNNGTFTVSTALSGTGGLSNGSGATLNIGGTSGITTLTPNAAANTINYTGGAQTVKVPSTNNYYHLGLSGSGAKTMTSIGTIAGDLTMSNTVTATTASAFSVGGNLQINNTAALTMGANLTFAVTGTTSVTGTLNCAAGGTGTRAFTGAVTINSGGTFDLSTCNPATTYDNGITMSGTTFNNGSGTVAFQTNSKVVTANAAMTFGGAATASMTLQFAGAGTITFSSTFAISSAVSVSNNNTGGVTITGNLTGGNGSSTWSNGPTTSGAYAKFGGAVLSTGVLTPSTSNSNTIEYTGAGQTIKSPSANYYHLTLSGSGTPVLPGAMTINGNFQVLGTVSVTTAGAMTVSGSLTVGTGTASTLTQGAFSLSVTGSVSIGSTATLVGASGQNLNVGGNFTKTGNFTHGSGTVILNGGAQQTVTGTITFQNLTVTNASGSDAQTSPSVIFADGYNYTVSGTLTATTDNVKLRFPQGPTYSFAAVGITFNRSSAGKIYLRSNASGTQWRFNVTGTQSVSYVDVKDSNAIGNAIDATNGTNTDSTNNTNWTWPPTTITISGTADATNANGTVYVAVNGVYQSGKSGTIGAGSPYSWTISGVTSPTAGQAVTVWVNGVADTNESTGVTLYSGVNITGMVLTTNVLSVGSSQNQSLTLANVGAYTCSSNEDVMQAWSSPTLTVQGCTNSYTSPTISVLSGNTLTVAGASSEALTTVNLTNAGTLTASGNATFNVSGNWTNSGTFTKATSTVNFNGTASGKTINTGGTGSTKDFYNVSFNGANDNGHWTPQTNTMTVTNDLIMTHGYLDSSAGSTSNVTVNGNVQCLTTCGYINFTDNTFAFSLSGGVTKMFGTNVAVATDWTFYNLNMVSTSGTNIVRTNATGTGKFVITGLTLSDGGVGVQTTFDAQTNARVIDVGTSGVSINSRTVFQAPTTQNFTVAGSFSCIGTFTPGTGTVTFDGTTGSLFVNSTSSFYNVTFNGSGGGWQSDTTALTVTNDLTMIAGTYDPFAGATVNGNVQCSGTCGTITATGGTFTQSVATSKAFGTNVAVATDWTFNNLTFTNTAATAPTITFNTTGTGQVIVSGNLTMTNGGTSLAVTDANNRILDVNGNFNISTANVTFTAPASASFTVAGSWSDSGAFTHNSGTVTFDAGATGKTISTETFNNVIFNNASGGWNFGSSTLTVAGNLDMSLGAITAGTSTVIMTGNKLITGGNQTLNNLQISALLTLQTSNLTVSGTLTLDSAKYISINTGITLTDSSTADVAGTGSLIGSGLVVFNSGTTGGPGGTMSTLNVPVRFDASANNIPAAVFDAREYVADVEIYSNNAAARIVYAPVSGTFTMDQSLTTTCTGSCTSLTLDMDDTTDPTLGQVAASPEGLFIGANTTFLAPSSTTVTVNGDFQNNGTYTHDNGTVRFSNTLSINGSIDTTFYDVIMGDFSADTVTVNGTDDPTIAGTLTFTTPAVTVNTFSIGSGRTVTMSGSTDIAGTVGTISGAGTLIFNSSTTGGPGTAITISSPVRFDATAASIPGAVFDARTYGGAVEIYSNSGTGKSVSTVGAGTYVFSSTLTVTTAGAGATTLDMNTTDPTAFTVSGTLTNGTGSIIQATSSGTFNINGSYTNNGTFTHNSGTVTAAGSGAQTFAGTMITTSAFGTLAITNSSGSYSGTCGDTVTAGVTFSDVMTTGTLTIATNDVRVKFHAGVTTTVSTSLTLTGTSGHRVVLRSDAGTAWTIAAPASRSVDYVDVAYSTVSGTAIDVTNGHSQDCTNNVNWTWPSAPITLSGIAYSDDGSTPLASSGGTFKVVNGTTGNTTSSAGGTDGSGNWSITGVTAPSNGDVLTIWINGATPDGALVLKYGASCTGTPNCTGLALYQNRVILRNEHTGNLANTDFANCDNDSGTNCGDTQIGFTDNLSGTYNLSVASGRKLYIWGGDNLTAGGTVTTAAAATAGNPDGDIYIAASATLDMAANALSVGGDFINAGTFSNSTGQTTTFSATGTGFSITPNGHAFQNVTFNGSGGGWSNSAAIVFTGDLTMTAGTFSGSQNVQFSGNVACGASTCGTINQSGTWSRSNINSFNFGQSVSGATNDWTFGSIQINPSSVSQTMTFNSVGAGTAKIIVSGLFFISANTYDPTITLTVDNNTNDRILEIGGNFSIGLSGGTKFEASNTAALTVSGGWTLGGYGVFTHNNDTVTFNGTGGTINTGTNASPFYNVIFNGSGSWSPQTNIMTIANDLTMTAGTLNNTLGTADMTVNGNVQCGATCGTINFGTTTTFTQSVSADKSFGTNLAGADNWFFYNLTFTGTSGDRTITINGTNTGQIIVQNNFSLTNSGTSLVLQDNTNDRILDLVNVDIGAGTTLSAPSTATALYISGNVTRTGTFTDNGGTVTLDGSSQQTLNSAMTTATNDFNNLTVTNNSGTDPQTSPSVIFADAMTVSGTFTATTNDVKMRFQPAVAFTATAINFDSPSTGYIYLRSNTSGSAWNFNVSGTPTVTDVNVKDSNAAGGSQITATDTTNYDATGNTNWNFGARIIVSGSANGNLGATVKVAFGGTLQKHTAIIGSGTPNWSITSLIAPSANSKVVVWVDGVADANESNAITKYVGTGDMTGMQLNTNVLSVGSANSVTLPQADLSSVYNNTNDEDIMFTCPVSGSCTLNVDVNNVYSNETLEILGGMTMSMTDDTTNTKNLQIDATGSLTAGNGQIHASGNWLNNGTFTANASKVYFEATDTGHTIEPGSSSFYDVIFDGVGGAWSAKTAATLTITGSLSIGNGTLDNATGTSNITVNGGVTCYGTCGTINLTDTGSTFTQSVSAAQDFGSTAVASNWTFNNLTFSGSTRTITSQGTGTITVNGTLTVGSGLILDAGAKTWTMPGTGTALTLTGSLTASTSTFEFKKTTSNTIPATTYYNLSLNPASGTPTYTLQNSTYTIGGNLAVTSNVTVTPGTSSVVMTGASKTADTQGKTLYDFSTTGTASVSLTSALYASNNISIGSGTTLSGSQNVTSIGGNFTGDGTVTLTGGTTTLEGTGTLGGAGTTDWTLNNLTLTQPASCSVTCSALCDRTTSTASGSGKMIVTGQVTGTSCSYGGMESPATSYHTLNAGAKTWDMSYNGAPFSVNFSRGTSTVRYIGSSNMTVGAMSYYNLVLQPSSGTPTYTFAGGLTVGKDLTIASTLNLTEGTATVTVGGLGLTSTVDAGDQTIYTFDTSSSGADIINLTSNLTTTNAVFCHVNDTVNITTGKTMTIEDNANAFNSALFADDATCTFSGGTVKYRDANAPDSLMVINSDFIYDATSTDQAAPARSFGGNLTFENSGSSTRVTTLAAGTHTVTGNLTVQSTGAGGLTVAGATYNPTVNVTGNLSYGAANSKIITSGSGTWTVTGNVDFTNGTYTASTNNTLIMDGTTKVFTHNSQALYNFTSNGSISMSAGNETVTGTLTINSSKSLTSTTGILSVGGNFTNNNTFNANGGTVALTTSAAATITGSNTFYNLSVTGIGAAKTVNFTGNTTTTVSGTFTITGASGQLVTLQSTDTNSWTINPAAASVDWSAVSRSTNTGVTFCAKDSTDNGNNINWNFSNSSSCGQLISGYIYTDEGSTAYQCASAGNLTITTKVNGSAGRSATCLTNSGYYSMYVAATANQTIITYIDNGTPKAATITHMANPVADLSGINLYQNRVIVRDENGTAMNNTDLAQYDYENDNDIPFSSNLSGTYNLVVNAGTKLFIWANKTFTPGGTVTTTAASTAVNPDGDIYIGTGATLAMAANALSVGGDWQNYGTFSHSGTQTTTFTATGTGFSIRSNASPFHNLTFNGVGGDWTETDALAVDNDLAMTNGSLLGSQDVSVGGSATGAGIITLSGGTFTHSPSTTASFGTTSGGNNWTFNDLTFSNAASSSPTTSFASGGTGQTIVNGTLALTNGGTSLVVDDNTNNRIIDANGAVTIGTATTLQAPPTASFTVGGNWTNSNVFTSDGGTVIFDASSTGKTITDGGSDWGTVVFNNSNGGWSFADSTIMAGNLTVTAGTLSGTNDITVNGGAVTGNGTINLTGGTFLVDGAGNFGGATGWNFSSLTFGDGTGTTATTKTGANQITASGVLTIAANQELNASSSTWVVSGSSTPFVINGVFTPSTSTFQYTGTGTTNVTSTTYGTLTLQPASGTPTYNLAGNINAGGDLNLATGLVLNAGTTLVTMTGTSNNIVGGGQSLYDLTIDPATAGTITLPTSDLTVSHTLTVAAGDALSLSSGRVLTDSGNTDVAGTGTISGAGTLRFTDTSGGPGTTLTTLSSIVRYDATASNVAFGTVDARTYGSDLEFYSDAAATRSLTFGAGTFDITGNLKVITGASQSLVPTVDGSSQNPTVNVTSDLTFTKGGSATPAITTGSGIWTIGNDANLTNGTFTASTGNTLRMSGAKDGTGSLTSASQTLQNFAVTGGSISTADAMDVNGTWSLTSGTFTQNATANMNIAGNFTLANGTTFNKSANSGIIIFDGDLQYNDQHTTKVDVGDLQIGASPQTTTLTSDMKAHKVDIKSSDTLITDGYDMDIGTGGITVENTGTPGVLNASDNGGAGGVSLINTEDKFDNSGTFTAGTSTLTFDGTPGSPATVTLKTSGSSLYNLVVNDPTNANLTVELQDALTAGNNITITQGALDTKSGSNFGITLAGNWSNASTFTAQNGTVTFNATGTGHTINPGSSSFYNLSFDGSGGAWSPLGSAMTITNDLIMTAGTFDTSNGTANVTVNGNVQCNTTCGTINMTSTNTFMQSVTADKSFGTNITGTTNWTFYNLTFTGTSGVRTITTNGTGTGQIIVTNDLSTTNSGTSLALDNNTNDRILDVGNDVSIGTGTTLSASNSASFTVAGNWTTTGAFTHNGGTVTFDAASGTKTINPGSSAFGTVAFNNASGTWRPATNTLTLANNLNVTAGTMDNETNDQILDVGGDVTIGGSGVLQSSSTASFTVGGAWTNAGTFTANSGTVTFDAATGTKVIDSTGASTASFNNITFNDGGGPATFQLGSALDVNGNLLITGGALDTKSGSNYPITIAGNWTNNDTFTAQSGTVTADGAAQQTFSGTLTGATGKFNNLTITNVSGSDPDTSPSVIFSSAAETAGTFTATTANTKLRFNAGDTYTLQNISFNGQAQHTRVYLRSSSGGSAWNLNSAGTRTVKNTDVKDSYACGQPPDIDGTHVSNKNSGGNSCWNFQALTFTLSANAINLGTLSTGAVATASHTVQTVTSADNGYVTLVYVDGDLRSGSNTINAASGTLSAGTEGYGIATSDAGQTVTQDTSCGSAPYNVTALTTSQQAVAGATSGPADETSTICYQAAIASDTVAGAYSQVVTFVTVGLF